MTDCKIDLIKKQKQKKKKQNQKIGFSRFINYLEKKRTKNNMNCLKENVWMGEWFQKEKYKNPLWKQ